MSATAAIDDREFAFSDDDFRCIVELVRDHSGIMLPPAKAQLVYSRIAKRVRATGAGSFKRYLDQIAHDDAERDAAVYALTTNHTAFLRENHHFEHLASVAWPPLVRRLEQGGRVRIWSSACSSGEEPLTIAMTIAGRDRGAPARWARRDLSILATDLSLPILATARAGRYPAQALSGMPATQREIWFQPQRDGSLQADPDLLGLIRYRQLNLLQKWPMRRLFDVIFCRNVMIYFDEPTKATLQARLCDQLEPGGFLYIGHSERLAPATAAKFRQVGNTLYQKVS